MVSLSSTTVIDLPRLAGLAFAVVSTYIIGTVLYRLFFHPLRSFPGPILFRISRLPWFYYSMKGQLPYKILALHEKYGKTIRVAPNEVSILDPAAWKEFYGHRAGGEFHKNIDFYKPSRYLPTSIITADHDEHAVLRRRLAVGFSDRAMREQEPMIGGYVDLLIRRLQEKCDNGRNALNMREWYNFTTFDIIGDLTFGESFSCLKDSTYHFWVLNITSMIRETALVSGLGLLGFGWVLDYLVKNGLLKARANQAKYTQEKLKRRMDLGVERPDLIEGLLTGKSELGESVTLSMSNLLANTTTLIVAGSETTATLLCGVTYFLLTNRHALERLTNEVRTRFKSQDEITLMSVNADLPYMLACLNEALRLYPPVAGTLPRTVPKGGVTVAGEFIPESTTVGVYQYAMYRYKNLWKNPYKFAPERFLGDPEYTNDNRDSLEPFSYGPRNCVGKNLAYAEMRLILARIIFAFDMEIAEDSKNWLNQKVYVLWKKPALNVHLIPVDR